MMPDTPQSAYVVHDTLRTAIPPWQPTCQFGAHVVQCAFAGRHICIFSGGAFDSDDAKFFEGVQAIQDGGGFGSIIGRNSFERPKENALELLGGVIDHLLGKVRDLSCLLRRGNCS